jgi:hypothetical protein
MRDHAAIERRIRQLLPSWVWTGTTPVAKAVATPGTFRLLKADDLGLVTGVVYEPNRPDSQGDWADPEVIREAAHRFLQKYRDHAAFLDEQHRAITDAADVVESWVAPVDITWPDGVVTKAGTWLITAKCRLDTPQGRALFEKVRNGNLTGFSFTGWGET